VVDSRSELENPSAKQLTKHESGVTSFSFSPDSKAIYFLAPDSLDKNDKERRDKKFDVRVRNQDVPRITFGHSISAPTRKRLTGSSAYSVANVEVSEDSQWIGSVASSRIATCEQLPKQLPFQTSIS